MEVKEHSVKMYAERVLNVDPERLGEETMDRIEQFIEDTAKHPDTVWNGEKDSCPIHIGNGCAIPVRNEGGRVFVPTAYHESTFKRKIEDYGE